MGLAARPGFGETLPSMFTGIIEATGEVDFLGENPDGRTSRLAVRLPFAGELAVGESVAVNGCCLTVTGADAGTGTAAFDLLAETLRATNLGDLRPGDVVNLERALRAGDRMSGHLVQGHVDTTAEVLAYETAGNDHRLEIELPAAFAPYVAYKGSIAVDGISLTVAAIDDDRPSFTIWIIPHTHEVTRLHTLAAGRRVNLEFDILAKYLERFVEARRPAG